MKRGQVSVEFLTIFGFVFLMTIPLVMIFFDTSGSVQDNLSYNHIRNIAIKIVDKAETVYYMGSPSKTTIKAFFPEHIEYINFVPALEDQSAKTELRIGYLTNENVINDIVVNSYINLTGSLTTATGTHYIQIEAMGDHVLITE